MPSQTASQTVDEETPLLEDPQPQKARTPIPWRQFSIVLFTQLAETFTFQVIVPFAPQLIREIGITHGDETQVGYYDGLLHSVLYATQALTVLHWCWVSDHIGRKPVILTGLFGLSASIYCFGLSKTFSRLVMSRALNGVLNGNIGVAKSIMVELTDSTNIAQAYAYMPIARSSGATLGSYIGGHLSKPADRFPDVFGKWTFFKAYPYFLACAVPATYSVLTWLVTFLFLKETLPHCVPFGRLIQDKFCRKSAGESETTIPELPSGTLGIETRDGPPKDDDSQPLPLRALLIPRVLIAAGNYASLSLLDIAFRTVQPLFFATPLELGGLGLDPPHIGNILSVYEVVNGLFRVLFFADLHDWFGSKAIVSAAVASGVPIVLTFPLINTLARAQGLNWMVWALVGVQLALAIVIDSAYTCIFIYIAAAAPTRASIGATNGIAQMLVSMVRTIGPASAASMFSLSIKSPEYAWYAYYYLQFLAGISIGVSLLLPRKPWTRST